MFSLGARPGRASGVRQPLAVCRTEACNGCIRAGRVAAATPGTGPAAPGRCVAGGLSAPAVDSEWVMTSYLAANAFILPVTGWLSAHFGRRNYFLWSIAVFTIASGLCGMATSLPQLILFRVIQGLAPAGSSPRARRSCWTASRSRSRAPPRRCSASPSWWGRSSARCSAAGSSSTTAGAGSSTSTRRWGSSASWPATPC